MNEYTKELKAHAERWADRRTEWDRAKRELHEAQARYDRVGAEVREAEGKLTNAVGSNINVRLLKISTGEFVLIEWHNSTFTSVRIVQDDSL